MAYVVGGTVYIMGPMPQFPVCNMKRTLLHVPNIHNRREGTGQGVSAVVEVVGLLWTNHSIAALMGQDR